MDGESVCYICLEEEGGEGETRECSFCRARLHKDCWERMVESTGKEECGVCRRSEKDVKRKVLLFFANFCLVLQSIVLGSTVLLYVICKEREYSVLLVAFLCLGTFASIASTAILNTGERSLYLLLN